MRIPAAKAWQLPSKAAFDKLLSALERSFAIRHQPGKVKRIQVLDNFDWSLWHGGISLVNLTGRDYLLDTGKREIEVRALRDSARFWWDFPAGECRSLLQKHSPLRALLPVATLRYAVHSYHLLNEDDKIVVRIKLIQHYSAETQQSRKIIGVYLEATPLRGYDEDFQRALIEIDNADFASAPLPNVQQLCLAQGVVAKAKPGKTYGLASTMPTEAAVRLMGVKMLERALEQRSGIIDDIDTEFLHQYRVHLRKARSLLSLLKRSLDDDLTGRLNSLLSELFSPTNQLRDLDVFLLERYYYLSILPAEYADGLNTLFDHVTRERHRCQRKVVRTLCSKVYQQRIDKVVADLKAEPDYKAEKASQLIGKVARKRILSRYRKVCRIGQSIDDATPDDEIHHLRKECKKLRYLMEFFAELFPKKVIAAVIKQLKKLQDILGQFNDYSVQQKFLTSLAEKEKSKSVLAAINGLIAILHQQQLQARSKVQAAFQTFSNDDTTAVFNALKVRK